MAYDEELAHRIRELLADEQGVSEVSMFGGLAFLLDGNISVTASGRGGLMVRADPDAAEQALSLPHARAMEMRGRTMKGWIRVDGEGVRTKRQLASWVRRGVQFARTLPPKG
jgi:TfoX/Sxy family transcriptional regulator of competence genes